jgi:hypothetical protein
MLQLDHRACTSLCKLTHLKLLVPRVYVPVVYRAVRCAVFVFRACAVSVQMLAIFEPRDEHPHQQKWNDQ